eukprot:6452324-Amphidinium_carterae.1
MCSEAHHKLLWQVYIDNLDILEVWTGRLQDVPRSRPDLMVSALAAYAKWNIPVSSTKEEIRTFHTKSLGTGIDGIRGLLFCPSDALMLTWCLVRFVVDGEPCSKHDLQVVLGRLVRILLYRRPLMCLLADSWKTLLTWTGCKPAPLALRRELSRVLLFLPLAIVDLKRPVSSLVTCSDASLTGGAIVASCTLMPKAAATVSSLLVSSPSVGDLIIVEWGACLGALRTALARCGHGVVGHLVTSHSPEANRCVQYQWPDAVFSPACTLETV